MWKEALEEFGSGPIHGSGYFENYLPIDYSEAGFHHYLKERTDAADP